MIAIFEGFVIVVVTLFRHKWSFTFRLLLSGQYMWGFRLFSIQLFRYTQVLLPQCIVVLVLIQLFRQSFTPKFIAQLSKELAFIRFFQPKLFFLLSMELISLHRLALIFRLSFTPRLIWFSTPIFIRSFQLRQSFIRFFILKLRQFFQLTFQLQLFSTLILFFLLILQQSFRLLFRFRQSFILQLQRLFILSFLQELLLLFIQFFRLKLISQPQLKLFSKQVLRQFYRHKQFFIQGFRFRWIFRFK